MKHLVAILAHKNPQQIAFLIEQCQHRGFDVLVHIDKKSSLLFKQSAEYTQIAPYTTSRSIDVQRGHFSLLDAMLLLLNESSTQSFDYFHLISGEDLPVKDSHAFAAFFTKNAGHNFINWLDLPASTYSDEPHPIFKEYAVFKDRIPTTNYRHKFFKNGIGLIDTYHFAPDSTLGKGIQYLTRFNTFKKVYLTIFKRKLRAQNYYAGSAWFSVTRAMVEFWINQTNKDKPFYHYFKHALFPDEIYFHTLAMNSEFKDTIVNSDLRYIDWENSNNFSPATLTPEHSYEIMNSNAFFARKFDLDQYPTAYDKLKI